MTPDLNPMEVAFQRSLGFGLTDDADGKESARMTRLQDINLKLAVNGLPTANFKDANSRDANRLVIRLAGLLENLKEKTRLLENKPCAVDSRIEAFLNNHFAEELVEPGMPYGRSLRIPNQAIVLDRHGLMRELSLPVDGDEFVSDYVHSYRTRNGVLHNPRSDRRTTQGSFHIVEGGLTTPADKLEVPRQTFVNLFREAVNPPEQLLLIPFTATQPEPERAKAWVSLLIRPIVRPEVPGSCPALTMETRFFAPGSLVSNLDFVESIFGNAGDPFSPAHDAALDLQHWSGHTGCVILAPHLTKLLKRDVGLPHRMEATDRQKHDGMCWEDASELYNDGNAFKITCRTAEGVIVTLIADNYFGYCKKEVKTQISFAANLMGGVEEEHAGGALLFPSWSYGYDLQLDKLRFNEYYWHEIHKARTFSDVVRNYGDCMHLQELCYGIDKHYPSIVYVPENARFSVSQQEISWSGIHGRHSIPLLPSHVYMSPSGFKVRVEQHNSTQWRIVGTAAEGILIHKPCTVSGGGKSELSKSLTDYKQYGSLFVHDLKEDLDIVQEILDRDYSKRWHHERQAEATRIYGTFPPRSIRDPNRSLGSVIQLLTPSDLLYNEEYNSWLRGLPPHIRPIVYAIKRFYDPAWGVARGSTQWRQHFTVNLVNGRPAHELYVRLPSQPSQGEGEADVRKHRIVGTFLRVGFIGARDGVWCTFKLRQDFAAAAKVQFEDDISVSTVLPLKSLPDYVRQSAERAFLDPRVSSRKCPPMSAKFVTNCEYRLFQRPDDAITPGFDKQTETDLSRPDVNFMSNFEPLRLADVKELTEKVVRFSSFTQPMREFLQLKNDKGGAKLGGGNEFVVCSANPRIVDGKRSKNPRYLQDRPDIERPIDRYIAEMGTRFWNGIPLASPVQFPVSAVISGRRNNPPDPVDKIRGLAVYNPLHYQELPELFMDYISSLTGKSPSTTGAGSEGALTKGPFNAVVPTADLNSALVSMILTGASGYSTAAGYVGPGYCFEHDISMLIPEVWCRMTPTEHEPEFLIAEGLLEKVSSFVNNGEMIRASRLGYRMNAKFVERFFSRVFDEPGKVFNEEVLRPELQDHEAFADGVKYITEAHQRVAQLYFDDGSIELACPPIRALLSIMAHGEFNGMTEDAPEIRCLFTLDSLLRSDWYLERLSIQQSRDVALWERHREYLMEQSAFAHRGEFDALAETQKKSVDEMIKRLRGEQYLDELSGGIGAEPSL